MAVFEGHHEDNVADAEVLVISTAVKADNPEVKAARARMIPVVRRAEMLGELMRLKWAIAIAGTHRSEEHTSELQSLMRISYAVFCLKKKNKNDNIKTK